MTLSTLLLISPEIVRVFFYYFNFFSCLDSGAEEILKNLGVSNIVILVCRTGAVDLLQPILTKVSPETGLSIPFDPMMGSRETIEALAVTCGACVSVERFSGLDEIVSCKHVFLLAGSNHR